MSEEARSHFPPLYLFFKKLTLFLFNFLEVEGRGEKGRFRPPWHLTFVDEILIISKCNA